MTTANAVGHIDARQLAVIGRGEASGWMHEFIPAMVMPMSEKGVDRSSRYMVYDRDPADGQIKPATVGFARSVILAQRVQRTDAWIATFVVPGASNTPVVPLFDMITPVTHPGHHAACKEEVLRLRSIMREHLQSLSRRGQKPGRSAEEAKQVEARLVAAGR